jgi:hypothetical protein
LPNRLLYSSLRVPCQWPCWFYLWWVVMDIPKEISTDKHGVSVYLSRKLLPRKPWEARIEHKLLTMIDRIARAAHVVVLNTCEWSLNLTQ